MVLALALLSSAMLLGSALTTEGSIKSEPDSLKGFNLIDDRFPARNEVTEYVVVRSESGTAADLRATVARLRTDLAAADGVKDVGDPFATGAGGLVSQDGTAVLVPVVMNDDGGADPTAGIADVVDAVEGVDAQDGVAATITGQWTLGYDFTLVSQHDLEKGEMQFGLPAALVVLLLVFGAVVAASVPLLMAVASIVVAVGVSAVVGQATDLSFFIVNMVIAMGLALGIDYSLFVTSRFREERHAGLDRLAAIAVCGATASKAVLFSGLSFVVALLGMLLVPDTVLRSLAFGAIVVGLVTVAAALTLLPATLALLGDRIERGRIPFVPRQHGGESPFWRRAVGRATKRPVVTVVVASGLLVLLALPVLGLRTGSAGLTTLPSDTVTQRGFAALTTYFPQGVRPSPAQVVVDAPSSPQVAAAVARLEERVAADPDFGPSTVTTAPGEDLTLVEVVVEGDPASSRASAAITRLRRDYIPTAFDGVDAPVYVTGTTAFDIDYAALIDHWLPIVITFVLTLSFLLLLLVFRSVVLPLKAVVLNLLSVGAAYGLMVLVFQDGHGADLLGLRQIDRVEPWVPVFLFSVLFALSMDYHVFLLTRIKERYLATGDTVDAVAHGVGATGRIITGAALIIVVVFVGFAQGDLVGFQQMGFGVAVALFIDATLIRTVLVPASMVLLGRWNWYLPGWLEWLPELHVEGGAEGEAERDAQVVPTGSAIRQ
ncbi:RND superfamily putative drug exporter [Nocardioides ginsengisegetis]|uniref:RND superfamily putative drug exporter n=1 Tax=Nocardioides ginsengisegetis TaxID=661491 RepID=A0A7W3P9F1_9ACTN|nr:RND superfamily putative drug exporter [Nocardioides ginsengisegetis]